MNTKIEEPIEDIEELKSEKSALSEYAGLKEQGADFDSTELYVWRMELCSAKAADASHHI